MRFAAIGLSTLAALAVTASAHAADLYLPVEDPYIPSTAVESWSGAYVGAHIGYGWGEAVEDDYNGSWKMEGILAGAHAGFNYQTGSIVMGIEADVTWTGIDGPYYFNGELDDDEYIASIAWMSTIRGRLGADFDGLLIYGTAGLAVAGLDISYDPLENYSSEVHVGYALGVGVEKKVTEDLSLRAEYLYTGFGGVDHYDSDDYAISFDAHTVKVGLSFHF